MTIFISINRLEKKVYLFWYIMTMFVRFFVTLFVISISMALFCIWRFTFLLINCFIIVFTLKKINKNQLIHIWQLKNDLYSNYLFFIAIFALLFVNGIIIVLALGYVSGMTLGVILCGINGVIHCMTLFVIVGVTFVFIMCLVYGFVYSFVNSMTLGFVVSVITIC